MKEDVNDILAAIDTHRFYADHIPALKLSAGKTQYLTNCPFPDHNDKKKSFSLNIDKGLFNCKSCGRSGNPIHLLMHLYGFSKGEAIERLTEDAGMKQRTGPTPKNGSRPKTPPTKTAPEAQGTAPKKSPYLTLEQVKTLHAQLMKNPSVLKAFQDKYGLSRETIEKYLIGYQNEHYVIPREIEPGKWLYKEHKGSQSLGSEVSIYPREVIDVAMLKETPYVIITEGEFKALLLIQMGLPAVSGMGGCKTWKSEWNHLFYELDVIFAYDNDEPGLTGSQIAADALRKHVKSVKRIAWPTSMNTKDRKDVTDYFVTMGKEKADFQELVKYAKKIPHIKKIDDYTYIDPDGFILTEDSVDEIIKVKPKTKDQKEITIHKPIFYSPLLITGCALDVDTGTEEVEVTFKQRRKWKSIWVPKRTISDMKKLVELSDHGLQVSSVNVKSMIEYLTAFEACNMDLIRLSYVVKGMGWKTVRDRKVFILGKPVTKADKRASKESKETAVEFTPEAGFERFVKAMQPSGKWEEWKSAAEKSLRFPFATFALYASFAAPLLRLLKAPNFIVDFWGNTSVGKTSVLELASSVWGNPHKESGGLVFSWDSTKVFLERIASFFNDCPIFPDDSQTVDDRTMTSMLYQIANGVGKGRGSITGIRQNPTWHTVCFSTGERPLTQCTTFSGAQARTISIYGSPFGPATGEFINDLKGVIREHYGHAGPKFIESIVPLWESKEEHAKLLEEYRRYQRTLSMQANTEVGDRFSHYFSAVKLAADLVCKHLGLGNAADAEESIYRVFSNMVAESMVNVDITTRAMQYVLSWASANEGFFKSTERESYGVWKEGDHIGIYPHKFTEVLKKENYSERAVLRGWWDREWIMREDEKHFTCARKVRMTDGQPVTRRLIVIPWDIVGKFISKGDR